MPDQVLELSYETVDSVPEAFRALYEEQDGKAVLTGINNLKTPQDVANVQEALRKEREDHGKVKQNLQAWGDLKPDEVKSKLDRIPELEAAAAGKLDDDKINGIVEGRVGQKVAPLERQIQSLTEERDQWRTQAEGFQKEILTRDRNDIVRSVAMDMKVHSSALDDILMVAGHYLERTDDGKFIVRADAPNGVTPGLDAKGFMKEMQKLRPHWWPASEGGGAGGGGNGIPTGSQNPWSHDGWNFTAQGNVIREQGQEVAERMAKAAGTTVGGLKPPKK